MASEEPKTNHEAGRGLPPVLPPSGRHIVQLFVVPGLIVTVAVLLLMGFSWLVSGESTADQLLKRLQDANPDVRWRAANDLAQRLKRDNPMAADPQLAQRLTTLLQQAVNDYDRAGQDLARSHQDKDQEAIVRDQNNLKIKRKDVQFLSGCVGNLILPTGAPVLQDIARREKGPDEKSLTLLRRQAVWCLATLAENLQRFDKLPPERQDALRPEMAARSGVIATLAICANSDDRFTRKLVALALAVWQGDERENDLAEETLLKLATTNQAFGSEIEIGEDD